MGFKRSGGRTRKAVRREGAVTYLRYTLLSFALTVTLVRFFLELTGYPQLGGGDIHIAHVLWGGLALFSAALLVLLLANRWAYSFSAVLAGIGVGLFIDEVGKFITQSNDYFYPAAAPIVYAFFLLILWLYMHIKRLPSLSIRDELYRALGEMGEVLDHDLESEERKNLEKRLQRITQHAEHADYRRLAQQLQEFVDSESLQVVPDRKRVFEGFIDYAQQIERRWISLGTLKAILIGALLGVSIVTIVDFARLLSGITNPTILTPWIDDLLSLGLATSKSAIFWFATLTILEGLVGLLLIVAVILMLLKPQRIGLELAASGLLLSIAGVDLLVFYFRQFSTIVTVMVQFTLLMMIYRYRSRMQGEGQEDR